MSKSYDAIVIGAGIVGCCTGYELAKRGYRTLNVDKLHGAGYGSTSSSCDLSRRSRGAQQAPNSLRDRWIERAVLLEEIDTLPADVAISVRRTHTVLNASTKT